MFTYFIWKLLYFITLPILSLLGLTYGNLFFIILYCLILILSCIKFRSAAVIISSVLAFSVLLVLLTKHYSAMTTSNANVLMYLPAIEIYYGIFFYIISWSVITLLQMVRAQIYTPLQHRARALIFIFAAMIIISLYYGYTQIRKYVTHSTSFHTQSR